MRVHFKSDGGLAYMPALSRTSTIEADRLSSDESKELSRLVEAAGFFDEAVQDFPPPAKAADYRRYTITIEDGQRSKTVTLADPIKDSNWQALVAFLQARARAKP
jgi:hypothetical protein